MRRAASLAVLPRTGVALALAIASAGAVMGALASAGPVPASSAFQPSIGLTRAQVETLIHGLDGGRTMFRAASPVKGVPRVLGGDKPLYTIVEVNGSPEVIDVQLASLLDTASKVTLEDQVNYDSHVCGALSNDQSAQAWCEGRVLNTNAHGLVNATKAATFGRVRITVKTYENAKRSSPPVVSVNITAA